MAPPRRRTRELKEPKEEKPAGRIEEENEIEPEVFQFTFSEEGLTAEQCAEKMRSLTVKIIQSSVIQLLPFRQKRSSCKQYLKTISFDLSQKYWSVGRINHSSVSIAIGFTLPVPVSCHIYKNVK